MNNESWAIEDPSMLVGLAVWYYPAGILGITRDKGSIVRIRNNGYFSVILDNGKVLEHTNFLSVKLTWWSVKKLNKMIRKHNRS